MEKEDTAHVNQSTHHDFSVAISFGNDLVVSVEYWLLRGLPYTIELFISKY